MTSRYDSADDLARDILHALLQSPHRVKQSRGGPDVMQIVADEVVRHLVRCGWRLARQPPVEPHSAG